MTLYQRANKSPKGKEFEDMVGHPSRRKANVFKEPDHAISATALSTKYMSTLRLLPMLPNSSLTSLLYLSVGYMLAEKGAVVAGLLALTCLLLKAVISLIYLILETLHKE